MIQDKIYLVLKEDLDKKGCPYCSCCSVSVFFEIINGSLNVCDSCVRPLYVQNDLDKQIVINHLSSEDKNKLINAINNYPEIERDCSTCMKRPIYNEEAVVFKTGLFNTPGCFVSGGNSGIHCALILKSSCRKAAQKIAGFFEAGAFAESDFVVVGSKKEYLPYLNKLMLKVAKTERIEANFVLELQRLAQ